jgi:hypothetical protein
MAFLMMAELPDAMPTGIKLRRLGRPALVEL